jgi:hypothetical protein
MKPQRKWLVLLRWLAFVPCAALAAWLAWLAVFSGIKFILRMKGITLPNDFTYIVLPRIISSSVLGAVFVYTGLFIAPANRKRVAYILGGLIVALAAGAAYTAVTRMHWWDLVDIAAMSAAAGFVCFLRGRNTSHEKETGGPASPCRTAGEAVS